MDEPDVVVEAVRGGSYTAPDLDGDGLADLAVSDDAFDALRGQAFVFLGPLPAGRLPQHGAARAWLGEQTGDWLGQELASGGDLDGDGGQELLISAMGWPGLDRRGRVCGLDLDAAEVAAAELIVDGEEGVQHLGRAMVVADLDGDGQDDVVLGAPSLDLLDPTLPGRAMVFYGPVSGHLSAAEADRAWAGEHPGDEFGSAMIAADLDGDGASDLVVASPRNDDGGPNAGRVYAILGPIGP